MFPRLGTHAAIVSLAVALVEIAVLRPVRAQDDNLYRLDKSRLKLGSTLFKSDLTRNPGRYPFEEIQEKPGPVVRSNGKLYMTATASAKETIRAMGLDVRGSFHGFGVGVYAGVNLSDEAAEQTQAVSLVLTFEGDYGTFEIAGNNPKPRLEELQLAKDDPKQFFEDVGTHYVSAVRKGSSIAIVYTWSGAGADVRRMAAVDGGFKGWGAGLDSKYQQSFVDAVQRNAFTVNVNVSGNDPTLKAIAQKALTTVRALGDAKSSFDDIMKAVEATIMASFENEKPQPVETVYYIAPLEPLFRAQINRGFGLLDPQESALEDVFKAGRRCRKLVDRINQLQDIGGVVGADVDQAARKYLADLEDAHGAIKKIEVTGAARAKVPVEPELPDGDRQVKLFQHSKVRELQRRDELERLRTEVAEFRANGLQYKSKRFRVTLGSINDGIPIAPIEKLQEHFRLDLGIPANSRVLNAWWDVAANSHSLAKFDDFTLEPDGNAVKVRLHCPSFGENSITVNVHALYTGPMVPAAGP